MALNTAIKPRQKWTLTFDQPSCPASVGTDSAAQTAKGATTDMAFEVRRPTTLSSNIVLSAKCSTKDQIIITFHNISVAAVDPPSLTYEVFAF